MKETGADPGELLAARWTDITEQARTLAINYPVKGHRARILPISKEFVSRVKLLRDKTERIFPMTFRAIYTNFWQQRRRIAKSFNNPRLLEIKFTTFQHWKATTEYHKMRDILHVQRLLGHKSLSSNMIYIDIEKAIYGQLIDEEFTVRAATSLEDDQKLIETGFEYVTERNGAKIYRKRK
ncbi:MAG: site-specific integrase [Candidatus Bathyarchaeota archaeon]|nr:site-specific integrase [Candidatus Bathyarchaeota archaeon]